MIKMSSLLNSLSWLSVQACEELQIFCSTCTPAQLLHLKHAAVLPPSAAQCGLITKSDAERLCSLLLQEPQPAKRTPTPSHTPASPPSGAVSPPRGDPTSFKIKHHCFGDCVGVLHPQSYSSPGAKCIGKGRFQIFTKNGTFFNYFFSSTKVCHGYNKFQSSLWDSIELFNGQIV